MKYLKSYESLNVVEEYMEEISEILQSWIDDFNFDIIKRNPERSLVWRQENNPQNFPWDGVYYNICIEKNSIEIEFIINGIENYWKEYNEIKKHIGELVERFKSNYKYVDYQNHSRSVSLDRRYLVISISI
jgi:hypothetical protein